MNSSVLAVEEALNNAISLIQGYSERDPYDKDPQNPWNQPQTMLDTLNQARDKVMATWQQLDSEQNDNNATTTTHHHPDVRALYMDMVTDAFADVLEDLRQSTDPTDLDVDILVDCLQSGLDLLTSEERALLCSMQDDDDDDDDDDDYDEGEEDDDMEEVFNNIPEDKKESNLVTCQ
jgi:hypothetical protein